MSQSLSIVFAFPGDLATPTGGYAYDRRIMAALTTLGHRPRPLSLGAGFPTPDARRLAQAANILARRSQGFDAVIVDGLAFGAFSPAMVKAIKPRPLALVHHPLFLETGLSAPLREKLRASESLALQEAAAVIVTSEATAKDVERALSIDPDKIFVAKPGQDQAALMSLDASGKQHLTSDVAPLHLLAVGAVTPRKGYADLIVALAETPGSWRLSIVGALDRAPDHVAFLRGLIAERQLDQRIHLAGALSEQALAEAYARADIFVQASRYEGFGMALAEAVAYGLPIVATDKAAAPGAAPRQAMLIAPAGNSEILRALLTDLLVNPSQRAHLAQASAQAAQNLPRWTDAALNMLAAIRYTQQTEKRS